MSATLNVYAVSFDRLRRVPGSRDPELAAAIAEGLESFLARIDELADDEEGAVPTCREAVAQIIDGAPLDDRLGYLYGYALEAICAHLSRELPNISAISRASRWVDEIDEALRAVGVPVRLIDLIFGHGPIPLPTPDDNPYIGCWTPEAVAGALAAARGADLTGLDGETADTIAQVRGWIEAAAETPGVGLVGFLC